MDFKDHGFKPEDVVKGLNEYYEKIKKEGVYGTFIVRTGTDRIGETYYMNPEVYVKEAIDWLREEHGIFYTPGMKLEDDTNDIFDNPRYKFLSILSSELGFRTIVGPGNAEKTEDAIMRAVKCRNDELKSLRARRDDEESETASRREFLCKLGYELGIKYPVVKIGKEAEMEADILERIGKLKEGNWPCENGNTFAEHMKKQFPKECEKWNVAPLQGGSVHDWVQYIFGMLDEWRKRALKAEEDREDFAGLVGLGRSSSWSQMFEKVRGILNDNNRLQHFRDTVYINLNYQPHTSEILAVDEVKAYRTALRELYFATVGVNPDNGANPDAMKSVILQRFKQKDGDREHTRELYDMSLSLLGQLTSACKEYLGCGDIPVQKMVEKLDSRKDALFELRAKVREIYRAFHGCWEDGYSYCSALNDINEEYKRLSYDYAVAYKANKDLQEEYDRYQLAVGSLLDIPKEARKDISAIERSFTYSKDCYEKLQDFRNEVKLAVNEYCSNNSPTHDDILKALYKMRHDCDNNQKANDKLDSLCRLRSNICSHVIFCGGEVSDEYILKELEALRCNTDYFKAFEKDCSERQAFIFKLCEALDLDKESIGSFFDDEEAAILKAIEDNNKATASVYKWNQAYSDVRRLLDISPDADSGEMVGALNKIICDRAKLETRLAIAKMMRTEPDRLRKMWHSRYESEHKRANGEHKRAEKLQKEVHDWTIRCNSAERALNARYNEETGLQAFKNELRKLKDEKSKVINALGQDIWDDCLK